MNIDRDKIIKAVVILVALFIGVIGLTKLVGSNSLTLTEYAEQNPELNEDKESEEATGESEVGKSDLAASEEGIDATNNSSLNETDVATENLQNEEDILPISTLTGAALNADIPKNLRISYTESFYYEPLSDNLRRYITGVSYPAASQSEDESSEESGVLTEEELAISYDELRYVHILHYDFDGNLAEGELICNEYIAQDLVEIFYELYRNEYQLEKVRLIDEYDGDDTASMEDNNTSCFNYRMVAGSTSLSKHALGLAIDINPLYNPYITYNDDGSKNIAPVNGSAYADRDVNFPYKIDENDLCYKLFTDRGFIWGGNWNSSKDYQHFQKTPANNANK